MPGLYDQLESHLDDKKLQDITPFFEHLNNQLDNESAGITPVDLMRLPKSQKSIMLFLLRDVQTTMQGISPEELKRKLSDAPDDLLDILIQLAKNGWLIALGEPPQMRFKVHMRRKRGSTLGFGIWSSLSELVPKEKN